MAAVTSRARHWSAALCALALCGFASLCDAKFQAGSLRLGGPKQDSHWQYVSKFGYDGSVGSFQVRVKLLKWRTLPPPARPHHIPMAPQMKIVETPALEEPVSFRLEAFADEDWVKANSLADACQRSQFARETRELRVGGDGNWSDWITGSVATHWRGAEMPRHRPRYWYFVISDCDQTLENITRRFRFEMKAEQGDGSQFSTDMTGMLSVNTVFLVGFSVFVLLCSRRTVAFAKASGSVHPIIWALAATMLLQYVAQIFRTIHLLRYAYNGYGVVTLKVIAEVFLMVNQVTQTAVLIMIALGYTLLQSKVGDLDLLIPLCMLVGMVQLLVLAFGMLQNDDAQKYHENDGIIGWILVVLHLSFYGLFLWAVQSSASESGTRLRRFLGKFRFMGSAYFLSYPLVFPATKCFAPYWQLSVMSVGFMCTQMSSNIWLASLFLKRGEYYKVSTLSSSMLPGGTKFGLIKDD